jgi:hypothetical protein
MQCTLHVTLACARSLTVCGAYAMDLPPAAGHVVHGADWSQVKALLQGFIAQPHGRQRPARCHWLRAHPGAPVSARAAFI